MLTQLIVKNIVLIDTINLEPGNGLTTLTGETGAGKSILLDALGLALGVRAESGLVRRGAEKGSVTAIFDCAPDHPARQFLTENDIDCANEDIIIRRSLTAETGRSAALVNDQPVSIGLLKTLGEKLVEIHGQFDTSGLLDVKTHLKALDRFGALQHNTENVKSAFETWKTAQKRLDTARARSCAAREREDYLRYCVEELTKLAPESGEEIRLTEIRNRLMHREKIAEAYNLLHSILSGEDGIETRLGSALSAAEKIVPLAGNTAENLMAALSRAQIEIEDANAHLSGLLGDEDEYTDANEIEERLFALKDCARKHHCAIEDLPQKKAALEEELALIDDFEDSLNRLENDARDMRAAYYASALELRELRHTVAEKLTIAVMAELPDLKLDKAAFFVRFTAIDDDSRWAAHGIDHIAFEVSTNPGAAPGAIHKIASGGELSRFMLALKLALAETSSVSTLVFDEVDSGIGGATADAVGLRLKKLSRYNQILVVTHSAQVAAKGDRQLQISKSSNADMTTTMLRILDDNDRLEEIARMLSGAEITSEARAAAARLISTKAA